jgi:hypothetical protein
MFQNSSATCFGIKYYLQAVLMFANKKYKVKLTKIKNHYICSLQLKYNVKQILKVSRMGLLYNRPIRYMVLQAFKFCVNAFISDVVKTVGRMVMFLILRTAWIPVFMFSW